jgi:purine-binding chemotaxis protein CheW
MNRNLQEIQLATFRLGDSLFALDIMRIREIIPSRRLSSLGSPSRYLDGVITLRGAVIPVMNMRKRFGLPPAEDEISAKLILVRLARQVLALSVDEVLEVITVPVADLKPPPETDGFGRECILGVCLDADFVFMILDIDALSGAADSVAAAENECTE